MVRKGSRVRVSFRAYKCLQIDPFWGRFAFEGCAAIAIVPLVARSARTPLTAGYDPPPPVESGAVTVKEHLQQVVSEMSEDEAADALALVAGARAGATPSDIYGTAWGQVLADVDPEALAASGDPAIAIPDGIPDIP